MRERTRPSSLTPSDKDSPPLPLPYESAGDFKRRRRRWATLWETHGEVFRFIIWMLGFFVAGLTLLILLSVL